MHFDKSDIKIALLFSVGVILITIGYYRNGWKAVDSPFYDNWQQIFEPPVVGRLVKSAQDGLFSKGALLGLGDINVGEGENPSVIIWMAPQAMINHQYSTYLDGKKFNTFVTYNSAPGFQGVLFALFDRLTNLSPATNLKLFRGAVALLTAITLAALFVWFALEFGDLSASLAILFASFSYWLTLLGGNLYWNLWAFYLPLVALLFLLRRFSTKGGYSAFMVNATLFIAALLKVLFNGFEFVTTAWVMYTVPFVYFAVRDCWTWRDFRQRMFAAFVVLSIVTVVGLLILATQVASIEGGYSAATTSILDALNRRSTGNPNNFDGPFAEALRSNLGAVLWKYLQFPTISWGGAKFSSHLLDSLIHLEYWVWVLFFIVASIFLVLRIKRIGERAVVSRGKALLAATWYSMLAPLSWLVIFKAHAYIHTRLAPVVWQMPFLFLGIALVGFTVSSIGGVSSVQETT